MERFNIGILASGKGSTFEAMCQNSVLRPYLRFLVYNEPQANVKWVADRFGVSNRLIHHRLFRSRSDFDLAILETFRDNEIDFVVCAGFMRILSEAFVSAFENRILNTHPSLLPRHPGAHAIRDCLLSGDRTTGFTIHKVDCGVDTGPILYQEPILVFPNDTEASLKKRIQAKERQVYPKIILDTIRS